MINHFFASVFVFVFVRLGDGHVGESFGKGGRGSRLGRKSMCVEGTERERRVVRWECRVVR